MHLVEIATYLGVGAVVGFLAGLLGIGGGIITVSTLALLFAAQGFPAAWLMHAAIGTSLAAMAAGSLGSFRAHHRMGSVDWTVVRGMTPGLVAGVVLGLFVARAASSVFLKYFFLTVMAAVTVQSVFNLRPQGARELPGRAGLLAMGTVIGIVSSLFGGGAAALGVPFLTWCRMGMHKAIGTSAALAFPLAILGTLGYALAGWSVPGLPAGSLGFVYIPAFLGISVTSMATAPWGARLAHRLRGATLRRIFALFLLALGVKVAVTV